MYKKKYITVLYVNSLFSRTPIGVPNKMENVEFSALSTVSYQLGDANFPNNVRSLCGHMYDKNLKQH